MRKTLALAVIVASTSAHAAWKDVAYTATLPAEAVYCEGLGNMEDFTAFVADQDTQGAMRMIAAGDCAMTTKAMKIQVFQEEPEEEFISFLSPSGKAFYSLKGYVK